jgi:hypothetical protein
LISAERVGMPGFNAAVDTSSSRIATLVIADMSRYGYN